MKVVSTKKAKKETASKELKGVREKVKKLTRKKKEEESEETKTGEEGKDKFSPGFSAEKAEELERIKDKAKNINLLVHHHQFLQPNVDYHN